MSGTVVFEDAKLKAVELIAETVTLNNFSVSTATTFQQTTNASNVTTNTLRFTNPATAFVTTGNVEVGTANLFVDTTTGNVGVGTMSPVQPLHIHNDDEHLYTRFTTTAASTTDIFDIACWNSTRSNGDTGIMFINRANTDMRFQTNDTERMRIKNDGNVGIGTYVPRTKLHVSSTGPNYTSASGNDRFRIEEQVTNGNRFGLQMGIDQGTGHSALQTYFLYTNGSYVASHDFTLQPHGGDVGIGTTNPTEKFHMHENLSTSGHQICARIGGSSSSTYSTLVFGSKEGRPHIGGHRGDYGAWADLSFQNDLMVLKQSNMCVGINKTNPSYPLDVKSDSSMHIEQVANATYETKIFGGAIFIRNPSTSSGYEHMIINNHTTGSHQTNYIQFRRGNTGNGSAIGSIVGNGSTISYGTGSDYRLKENVVPMQISGLDTINNLRPKRFNFIGHSDEIYDGFLAHELQEHIPTAVSGVKDEMRGRGNIVKIDDESIIVKEDVCEPDSLEEGTKWVKLSEEPVYQNVDLSKIVTYLVKAVQEADAQFQAEKAKVADLLARVEALENA